MVLDNMFDTNTYFSFPFSPYKSPHPIAIHNQRWASLPPEVTVKSLPLPTNLKIVTVNSFSLSKDASFLHTTILTMCTAKKEFKS
jgi:hypothetical protein